MKILIIDDHALFREGLCHVLQALDEEVDILEAANYEHAIRHVSGHPELDLILLDLNMPGKDGFSALDTLSAQYPALPVVILSASTQRSDIQRALDAGAMGYIPKDTTSSVMLGALRLILSGGIYVPPSMAQGDPENHTDAKNNTHGFTQRQLEVLAQMIQGVSNKEIANNLGLAEATVKMHVTAILKSLGVSNRTQAVVAVEKLGIFSS